MFIILRNFLMFGKVFLSLQVKQSVDKTDPIDVKLLSKFKKGFPSLLCVNKIYTEYARVVPLKVKNNI